MSSWRQILQGEMPEEIREELIAAFEKGRTVTLRPLVRETAGAPMHFLEVRDGSNPDQPHCSTCQCPKLHPRMPEHPAMPGVFRSRSWHHG